MDKTTKLKEIYLLTIKQLKRDIINGLNNNHNFSENDYKRLLGIIKEYNNLEPNPKNKLVEPLDSITIIDYAGQLNISEIIEICPNQVECEYSVIGSNKFGQPRPIDKKKVYISDPLALAIIGEKGKTLHTYQRYHQNPITKEYIFDGTVQVMIFSVEKYHRPINSLCSKKSKTN